MVPLNLILAATLVMTVNDSYQIVQIFRGFEGVYHFNAELLKSEFSTVVMAFFIVYGLAKGPDFRKMRWLFLLFLAMDSVFDVVDAFQSDGKTAAQVREAMRQMPYPLFYLNVQLPILVGVCIVLMAAVSFQMKKPFFYTYGRMEPWQSAALVVFSILYYVETLLGLFFAMGALGASGG